MEYRRNITTQKIYIIELQLMHIINFTRAKSNHNNYTKWKVYHRVPSPPGVTTDYPKDVNTLFKLLSWIISMVKI